MKAHELHDIEKGFIPPPDDEKWLKKIIKVLEIENESSDAIELEHLFRAPFIMQKMSENIIPVFAGDDDGPLPKDKLTHLRKWMRQQAIEHNKKADEYNKQHKVI
jgi:hypothetical protein